MTYFARRTRVHAVTAGATAAVLGVWSCSTSSSALSRGRLVPGPRQCPPAGGCPHPGAITSRVRGTFGQAGTVRGPVLA